MPGVTITYNRNSSEDILDANYVSTVTHSNVTYTLKDANAAKLDLSNIDNTAKIVIAHNAMPSSTVKALTVGATGSTITAPADGYVCISAVHQNNTNYGMVGLMIGTINNFTIRTRSACPSVNAGMMTYIPCKKNDTVTYEYSNVHSTSTYPTTLTFIYAVGSESEAS